MERKTERAILTPGVVSLRVGEPNKQKQESLSNSYENGCFHGCIDCGYDVECERAPDPLRPLEQRGKPAWG